MKPDGALVALLANVPLGAKALQLGERRIAKLVGDALFGTVTSVAFGIIVVSEGALLTVQPVVGVFALAFARLFVARLVDFRPTFISATFARDTFRKVEEPVGTFVAIRARKVILALARTNFILFVDKGWLALLARRSVIVTGAGKAVGKVGISLGALVAIVSVVLVFALASASVVITGRVGKVGRAVAFETGFFLVHRRLRIAVKVCGAGLTVDARRVVSTVHANATALALARHV